ncbi:hypothetical protein KY334_06065 [Candidatus Woesearchaeota archaeon]|nr:hypothetical protein [Candidatus Woesearchaeota archaeon]
MNIHELFSEIRNGIYKIRLLRAFLNGAFAYLIAYFISMIVSMPPLIVGSITFGVVFIYTILISLKEDPILLVESKYPELDEELRTVKDNFHKQNILVEELKKEVTSKVKRNVDMGDFVDFKKIISRILFMFFMSFLIIFVASLNIRLMSVGEVFDLSLDLMKDLGAEILRDGSQKLEVVLGDGELTGKFKNLALVAGVGGGTSDSGEIFGDSQVAQLGNEVVNIEIKPTDYELSIEDYENPEKMDFISSSFKEDDVFLEKDFSLEEDIPREKQDIVKRYFSELAKN